MLKMFQSGQKTTFCLSNTKLMYQLIFVWVKGDGSRCHIHDTPYDDVNIMLTNGFTVTN